MDMPQAAAQDELGPSTCEGGKTALRRGLPGQWGQSWAVGVAENHWF